jgi:hypothetical protein
MEVNNVKIGDLESAPLKQKGVEDVWTFKETDWKAKGSVEKDSLVRIVIRFNRGLDKEDRQTIMQEISKWFNSIGLRE